VELGCAWFWEILLRVSYAKMSKGRSVLAGQINRTPGPTDGAGQTQSGCEPYNEKALLLSPLCAVTGHTKAEVRPRDVGSLPQYCLGIKMRAPRSRTAMPEKGVRVKGRGRASHLFFQSGLDPQRCILPWTEGSGRRKRRADPHRFAGRCCATSSEVLCPPTPSALWDSLSGR